MLLYVSEWFFYLVLCSKPYAFTALISFICIALSMHKCKALHKAEGTFRSIIFLASFKILAFLLSQDNKTKEAISFVST